MLQVLLPVAGQSGVDERDALGGVADEDSTPRGRYRGGADEAAHEKQSANDKCETVKHPIPPTERSTT
ncbi:hypothetical protein, partial [Streptomyces sp. KL116D]|uniref:hypothetical protein n=1 Tax=Streptomyces sp. KL116D TaxID=3045152 RepID=UPI0035569CDC